MSKKQRKKSVAKARKKAMVIPADFHTIHGNARLGEKPKKGKK